MNKKLNVKNLKAWYGDSQALFGIDLKAEQGQMVALLGRNGMGKSTTIKPSTFAFLHFSKNLLSLY